MLPLIDWSHVHYDWSLSNIFGQLRGLVFYELKSRIWKAAIDRTSASSYDNPSLMLNNMKAAQAMAQFEAKVDPLEVLDNSMYPFLGHCIVYPCISST